MPSHILAKYQNLRNSLLSSGDFSLRKFDSTFSPRIPKNLSAGYSKLARLCLMSLQHILDKTFFILDSCGKSKSLNIESLASHRSSSKDDQVQDLTQLTYDIEDLEKKVIENLGILKDTITVLHNNLGILDEELRNSRVSLRREESVEAVYIENERLLRENEGFKEEIEVLKNSWSDELENARVKWTSSMDKMQDTYEKNIKELTESHEHQIMTLKKINQEKLNIAKETEEKLVEKLEKITSEQSEVLNKLNDKILFLTAKNNEDSIFIEKVMNKLDDVFEKFNFIDKEYFFNSMKEKILSKFEDLEAILQKNKAFLMNCTKSEAQKKVVSLKEKLKANNVVLKEFEDARFKLLQHFSDSPSSKKSGSQALTSRY